jgi:hypothetical protein
LAALFEFSAAGRADMIERDGPGAEKNQGEGQSGKSEREFVSMLAHESVVEVNFGDGNAEIETNGKTGDAGEQADKYQHAAKEFGKGGEVSGPGGKSQADDELHVMVKASEDLVISMAKHDGAQGEAHDEKREGLQTIEVVQGIPPAL